MCMADIWNTTLQTKNEATVATVKKTVIRLTGSNLIWHGKRWLSPAVTSFLEMNR